MDNIGTRNYINNSNIINENENSSDGDTILEKEKEKEKDNHYPQSTFNTISEKERRRFALEYIKVLALYEKGQKGQQINISDIMEEYEIPKELIEGKKIESESIHDNSEIESNIEIKEEKIDFDNDIQPIPTINHEMKIIIFLSKPKIIGFDGKLGLFYISPTPIGKDGGGYSIIVKNPENMKVVFRIKIIEIITCVRKSEKSLYLQNFGTKILTKTNHELIFKNGEECSLVYQGIVYLINNKEDDVFY